MLPAQPRRTTKNNILHAKNESGGPVGFSAFVRAKQYLFEDIMRKFGRSRIILALLLILVCSTVSHAAISKPKNFRIVYMSDKGTVLESFEWSVYAVQQVFVPVLTGRNE